MYCTECGAENDDGMRFCVQCGAPLEPVQSDNASLSASESTQTVADGQFQAKKTVRSGKRTGTVVAIAALVIAVCGGVGYYFGVYLPASAQVQKSEKANESGRSKCAVSIGASGDGWNTTEGDSKLPVHVTGTAANGSRVNKTMFVSSNGKGLKLVSGSYALTIEGSPIGTDGSLWNVPDLVAKLKIKSASKTSEVVNLSSKIKLTLGSKIDAADITDEQIDVAEKLAERGGCDSKTAAKALAAAARAARDAAISAKQAEDASAAQKRAEQEADSAKEAAEQKSQTVNSGESDTSPFWGAFVMAGRDRETSERKAEDLRNSGFPNTFVVCTTDWTNLNRETWYSVSVGRFSSKDEAEQAVSSLKAQGVSDAYSRYSGDHK